MEKCKGTNRRGKRCGNYPMSESEFCYSHNKNKSSVIGIVFNFIRNNLTLGLIITVLIFGYNEYSKQQDREEAEFQRKINTQTGKIYPYEDKSIIATKILVGGALMEVKNGVLFTDHGTPLVSINKVDGKLFISAIIYDDDGNVIAEILNNEWKINPNFSFDRNYTENLIEVKDNKGDIILQAVNLGDVIYFSGIVSCSNGDKWFFGYDFNIEVARFIKILKGKKINQKIMPFCYYPSYLNLGNCKPSTIRWKDITTDKGNILIDSGVNLCNKKSL